MKMKKLMMVAIGQDSGFFQGVGDEHSNQEA